MRNPFSLPVTESCTDPDGSITSRFKFLLCHMPSDSAGWQQLAQRGWPYLAAAVLVCVAAMLAWRWNARRVWEHNTKDAVWLEITPPVTATPSSSLELWRLLADKVPATGHLTLVPPRIAFEVHATPDRMRVGMWIPAKVGVLNVSQRIQQAWPGARVVQTEPPAPPQGEGLVLHGLRVVPSEPDSVDYLKDQLPGGGGLDPMRVLYDSMASAGRQGGVLLQILAQKAPPRRMAALNKMISDPARAHSGSAMTGRFFDTILSTVTSLVTEIFSIFGPSRPSTAKSRSPRQLTPDQQAMSDRARAKKLRGPLFLAGIRVFALGSDDEAARNAARQVAGGYVTITREIGTRKLRNLEHVAGSRWCPDNQMVLSSLPELAALATLPSEPAAYGIAAAASRRRAGIAEVWRPSPQPSTPDSDDDGDGFTFDPWAMA